jgi:hypothetical protein
MLFSVIINFEILPEGVLNRFIPLNWIDSKSSIERIFLYKSTLETILKNPLIGAGVVYFYWNCNKFISYKKESIFKNYRKGCFAKHEECLNFY